LVSVISILHENKTPGGAKFKLLKIKTRVKRRKIQVS
jgi:hypothetical protein